MTKIFLDGASLDLMDKFEVDGYTSNPTLIKQSKITKYMDFAKEFVKKAGDKPVSLEIVNADNIVEETKLLASLGPNVYVKIPIDGMKNIDIIGELSKNYKINVTAVFTAEQIRALYPALSRKTPSIVSIFAGRIADTGEDPLPYLRTALGYSWYNPAIEVLWASPREAYNIYQAHQIGCHIITVLPDILTKYYTLHGKNLHVYSIETAEQFYEDAKTLKL